MLRSKAESSPDVRGEGGEGGDTQKELSLLPNDPKEKVSKEGNNLYGEPQQTIKKSSATEKGGGEYTWS